MTVAGQPSDPAEQQYVKAPLDFSAYLAREGGAEFIEAAPHDPVIWNRR